MRSMPAIIVHLVPAWKRNDWKQLQTDAQKVRSTPLREMAIESVATHVEELSTP